MFETVSKTKVLVGAKELTVHVRKAPVFEGLTSDLRLSKEQLKFFDDHGYLVLRRFLDDSIVGKVRNRFQPVIIDGEFDTGMYPDEWYGGRNMAKEHITKEICNAWKSDRMIASVVLNEQLHRVSEQLLHCGVECGSRIAQDDLIWKPQKGGTPVGFHVDGHYISDQFILNVSETSKETAKSVTIWMPIDDVNLESGSIEYVCDSHRWPRLNTSLNESVFHSTVDHSVIDEDDCSMRNRISLLKKLVLNEQALSMIINGEVHFDVVEIPKGGVSFHIDRLWHGSGQNRSHSKDRRALVAHTLREDCQFRLDRPVGYIYGRYQSKDRPSHLDSSFFPICSGKSRSPWLSEYCGNPRILTASHSSSLRSKL